MQPTIAPHYHTWDQVNGAVHTHTTKEELHNYIRATGPSLLKIIECTCPCPDDDEQCLRCGMCYCCNNCQCTDDAGGQKVVQFDVIR